MRALTFLATAATDGEDSAARQPFHGKPLCGECIVPVDVRVNGYVQFRKCRDAIRAWRDTAPTGLMASCDFFAERSMQYGTYASANS